jgi:hypothetical protein
VIYDTASQGLIVETDLCSSCPRKTAFNTTTSTSFSKVSEELHKDLEASYNLYSNAAAFNATDTVYLTYPSIRADNFPFYAMYSMAGDDFTDVQGVLGFGRKDYYGNSGPLYMEKVKSTNHITTNQISFRLGAHNGTNYVDVGAVTASSIKDSSTAEVVWFDQPQNAPYWQFKAVQGIQIGFRKYTTTGFTAGYQYGYELEFPAIVATGDALITAP